MPTFAAMALDRLIEPGASRPPASNGEDRKSRTGTPPVVPHATLARPNSTPMPPVETERRAQRNQISPAFYVTPQPTPSPDSLASDSRLAFPDSPYVFNHKRRVPGLTKCLSEQDVVVNVVEGHKLEHGSVVTTGHFGGAQVLDRDLEATVSCDGVKEEVKENNSCGREIGGLEEGNGVVVVDEELPGVGRIGVKGDGEGDIDFFDPHESLSYTSSTDGEDNNGERSGRMSALREHFYDVWEELSSDSGPESRSLETELQDMRLSLLMEIEKRKQAEEALNNAQNQWQLLRQKMRGVGLVLPPDILPEDGKPDTDLAEEIFCQIHLSRLLSESIGMEVAKAEAEAKLEAHVETRNFEIARLNDRLHYYETMNREMSHRNQEAIERARHDRKKRRRRQRWVWASVGVAITLGSVALAWSYYAPGGKGSSSTNHLQAPEQESAPDS